MDYSKVYYEQRGKSFESSIIDEYIANQPMYSHLAKTLQTCLFRSLCETKPYVKSITCDFNTLTQNFDISIGLRRNRTSYTTYIRVSLDDAKSVDAGDKRFKRDAFELEDCDPVCLADHTVQTYCENDVKALNEAFEKMKEVTMNTATFPTIKCVHCSGPVTTVIWSDGVKSQVRVQGDDRIDYEKGIAMAISKRVLGNNGNYYETFKQWVPKTTEENK